MRPTHGCRVEAEVATNIRTCETKTWQSPPSSSCTHTSTSLDSCGGGLGLPKIAIVAGVSCRRRWLRPSQNYKLMSANKGNDARMQLNTHLHSSENWSFRLGSPRPQRWRLCSCPTIYWHTVRHAPTRSHTRLVVLMLPPGPICRKLLIYTTGLSEDSSTGLRPGHAAWALFCSNSPRSGFYLHRRKQSDDKLRTVFRTSACRSVVALHFW